jgi:hypothetical protein
MGLLTTADCFEKPKEVGDRKSEVANIAGIQGNIRGMS